MSAMPNTPKFLLASIVAALMTILIPLVTVLYVLFVEDSSILADGAPDDAPLKAAGLLLLIMPIIFIIFLTGW